MQQTSSPSFRQTHNNELKPSIPPAPQLNTQDLNAIFEKHKRFYSRNPYPSYEYRIILLNKMKEVLLRHKDQLANMVHQDFGNRPSSETFLLEIYQLIDQIHHTKKNLKRWMQPETRQVPLQLMPSTSQVIPQPKGVVGIISPWNYPILLSMSPLVTAIAAGNTAIIKGSEYCPNTNQCLEKICGEIFEGKNASFVQGNADFAHEFCCLPFDHLVFTGSATIGKKVMACASRNLTPVTLELGGKSPVIIDKDYDIKKAAEAIVFGKSLNAGQTCIAPDYILCNSEKVKPLIAALKVAFHKMYPTQANNEDYTSIISQTHFDRLQSLIKDAIDNYGNVISLSTDKDFCSTKKIPLTLVTQTNEKMKVMQEEIFGPILPIVEVDSIENAIQYVEAKESPLALYLFSDNKLTQKKVKLGVHAGGMSINDTLVHAASQNLPFGGIGHSGIGKYHGKEGFMELSHSKSVLQRGKWNPTTLLAPPWNQKIHRFVLKLLDR